MVLKQTHKKKLWKLSFVSLLHEKSSLTASAWNMVGIYQIHTNCIVRDCILTWRSIKNGDKTKIILFIFHFQFSCCSLSCCNLSLLHFFALTCARTMHISLQWSMRETNINKLLLTCTKKKCSKISFESFSLTAPERMTFCSLARSSRERSVSPLKVK